MARVTSTLPHCFWRASSTAWEAKSGFERHRLQRWPGQIARQQVTQRIRKARRIAISAVEAREHNRNAGLRVMLRRR
jgi:hypothetical protein